MRPEEAQYKLQTVEKALRVLELFYDAAELGAADVAARLGINRSTAFRFLVTLEDVGLICKQPNAKYRLSLKLFTLGQLAYGRNELGAAAHGNLEALAAATGETAHLTVLDGLRYVIFMDKALAQANLRMDIPIGARYVAHSSAGGKSILAHQPQEFIDRYLEAADFTPVTKTSIPDADTLLRTLAQVRRQGYGADREEAEPGLTCFGAPIIGADGVAIAAISVSGPTTRMLEKQTQIIALLKDAAKTISRTTRMG